MVGKSYHSAGEKTCDVPQQAGCGPVNVAPSVDPKYVRLYERRECLQLALQAQTPIPLELAKQFHEWLYGE